MRFRRRLAPVVIGQDGFLPSARGIVWDLRTKHPGGYYLPLDLSAPLPTHLKRPPISKHLATTIPISPSPPSQSWRPLLCRPGPPDRGLPPPPLACRRFANVDKNSAGRGRSATPSSATTKRALSYVALAQRAPLTSSSLLSPPSSPPFGTLVPARPISSTTLPPTLTPLLGHAATSSGASAALPMTAHRWWRFVTCAKATVPFCSRDPRRTILSLFTSATDPRTCPSSRTIPPTRLSGSNSQSSFAPFRPTYAHMKSAEYERFLLSAISAPITSSLSGNLPTTDADDCVAHLSDAVVGFFDCSAARQPLARLPARVGVSPPLTPPRSTSQQTLMTNVTMARLTVRRRRLDSTTLALPSAETTLLQAARSPFPSASTAQRFTTPVASCAQRRAPPPPPRNRTCPSLTATYTPFATTVSSPFSNWAPADLPRLPARHSERPVIFRLAPLSLSAGLPATVPRAAPAPRHSPPPEP